MSYVHVCRSCEGTTFTLKNNREGIKLVTCMVCGSQEEPLEQMVSASGRFIKTGIRHKPDYVKPRKDQTFGYRDREVWIRKPLGWAKEFDRRLR